MDRYEDTWEPLSWFCPNCATKVIAYKNDKGEFKVQCNRCGVVMVQKIKNRRCNRMEIYDAGDVDRWQRKLRTSAYRN